MFNDWQPDATPLQRDQDGHWSITLKLVPGRYEYKFIVDGQWCCNPGIPDDNDTAYLDCVPNEHGSMNRVIIVK